MSDLVLKEAVIKASTFSKMNPITCPACGTRDLILEGVWQRRFTQAIVDGEPEPPNGDEQYTESIRAIICPHNCHIRFHVQADEYITANLDNMAMRIKIAQLEGRSASDNTSGKVN